MVETADTLPAYEPRETDEKPVVSILPSRSSRKPVSKKTIETRANPSPVKTVEEVVFDKKGNVRPVADKKATSKNQPATSSKTDDITRPHIVKTPKF
ncbi:MAG: hypothetical protein ICV68_16325 [Pyrinomonadaceae bacterium]|nr:hypothetical protein [Pyrinomonadaceae bacterium]